MLTRLPLYLVMHAGVSPDALLGGLLLALAAYLGFAGRV
jgi:hypothetical protein